MCTLDLAKTTLYDFHYDYTIPKFNQNCKICYTDTDSLIYEITCPDIYEIIKRDCHTHFDTNDYPVNNVWHIPSVNKKVPVVCQQGQSLILLQGLDQVLGVLIAGLSNAVRQMEMT